MRLLFTVLKYLEIVFSVRDGADYGYRHEGRFVQQTSDGGYITIGSFFEDVKEFHM